MKRMIIERLSCINCDNKERRGWIRDERGTDGWIEKR